MNKKIFSYALVVIVVFSSTSCKKLIDYVNQHPTKPNGCRIVSTTELAAFDITVNDSTFEYEVPLPIIKKFYYNSKGYPDSIVWKLYGPDTMYLSTNGDFPVNSYFRYDAQGRLSGYLKRLYYDTAPISSKTWTTYTYPDAHTILENDGKVTNTLRLDDSNRVVSDGWRTYKYDSNGNLELNYANDFSWTNEQLADMGWGRLLTYNLDKKSPRQLSPVFMLIDRDFSKNASEMFYNFNSNGWAQSMGKNMFAPGWQDVLFGERPNGTISNSGDRTIQYSCQ